MKFDIMPVATEKQMEEIEKLAHEIWHDCYKDVFSAEQIDYMLNRFHSVKALKSQLSEQIIYYMLLLNNELIGYLSFKNQGDHIFLSQLYLKEKYRRQGVGRRILVMFDNLIGSAEFNSIKKIKLHVNRKSYGALHAFEHMKFKRVNAIDKEIGSGYFDKVYVMERRFNRNQGVSHGE